MNTNKWFHGILAALIAIVAILGIVSQASAQDEDDKPTKTITLADGRSPDPRTTLTDEELGVPAYADTGVGKKASWTLKVPQGWTLIVGGVIVSYDGVTHDNGFMIAIEGETPERKYRVVDGFYKYVESDWAWDEFCMRVQQHVDNSWLLSEYTVPENWDECPVAPADTQVTTDSTSEDGSNASSPVADPLTNDEFTLNSDGSIVVPDGMDPNTVIVNNRDRVDALANGGSDVINGASGDWAIGESIGVNGTIVCSSLCRVSDASNPFTVYGGVINPSVQEWNDAVTKGFKVVEV